MDGRPLTDELWWMAGGFVLFAVLLRLLELLADRIGRHLDPREPL